MSQGSQKRDSWIETREYPNTKMQIILSSFLLLLAVASFALSSSGDASTSIVFFVLFASLTVSVMIFPPYLEFSGVRSDLLSKGAVKAKTPTITGKYMPVVSAAMVLLVLPIVMLLVAPPALLWGSVTGIVFGFALSRILFSFYIARWGSSRGVRVVRYCMVSRTDMGKRVVLERGLKTAKY